MKGEPGILGTFRDGARVVAALRALRTEGLSRVESVGPYELHGAEDALDAERPSPVRAWTLAGGLLGLAAGLGLPAYSASAYALVLGGKPVLAWIPFLVIAFELTVLGGALASFLGLLVHGFALPARRGGPPYDPRFGVDLFGVWVGCADGDERERAAATLRAAGAEEVSDAPAE